MFWPDQGIFVFLCMSIAASLLAIVRRNLVGFAGSLLTGLLAVTLARYTYLVPVSVVLLIASFAFALRKFALNEQRWALWVSFALIFSPFGAGAVWLYFSYNWGPPAILGDAARFAGADQQMTDTLNARFPHGTDEALLRSVLLRQGFKDEPALYACRLEAREGRVVRFGECPPDTRWMTYQWSSLVCGVTVSVNWSVDQNRKLTRLQVSDRSACL
ncbi:hypothetical protein [Bradyrhizobium sp. 2TAF24]|uniref:hypothetical protein n=1 Tax=Bradyrhizobium sp. 2TAF24 TaxID=3233011 RepID=UPI003F8FB13A